MRGGEIVQTEVNKINRAVQKSDDWRLGYFVFMELLTLLMEVEMKCLNLQLKTRNQAPMMPIKVYKAT